MAFAALDYFYAHRQIPGYKTADFPTGCPPDGDPLADYIYSRLIDSFTCSTANQFISWSIASDHSTWLSPGVTAWTKNDSWPYLVGQINQGKPVALGLIQATSLSEIAQNHQIVAYGYDTDANGMMTVYVYDDDRPDEELTLQSGPANPHWNESDGQIWRGWFVQAYSPKVPPTIQAPAPVPVPSPLGTLTTSVVAAPSPIATNEPVAVTIHANDASNGNPVPGDVRVDGVEAGPTNTALKMVFHPHFLFSRGPAGHGFVRTPVWPTVTVVAAGYTDAEVDMPFEGGP